MGWIMLGGKMRRTVIDEDPRELQRERRAAAHIRANAEYVIRQSLEAWKKQDKRRRTEKGRRAARFLKSPEWRAVREVVFERDGRLCRQCGSTESLQIDHILPKSKFPELALSPENLQVLCWCCNRRKNTKTDT